MSQINANFQELISNNSNNNNQSNYLDSVTGTSIITSETLQGFSMANQFAICANSGNGPVLLSCLTPMLLPGLTGNSKTNFELAGVDGRGQNQPQTIQIQLASPFNFAGNLCSPNNNAQSLQSLGLSYINLSSLTNAGTSFPLQITLNNAPGNNNGSQQLTIPTATLNSLNQELQITQNYQISSQVKFEPDLNLSANQQQTQQHTLVSRVQDISDIDDKTKRKPRRRIPNKSNKSVALINGIENNNNNHNNNHNNNNINNSSNQITNSSERLLDHKGRPFIYNCPNCPKKFTLNSRLTAHLRCHTGIRPYTCTQCGFSFTQKSYLIRHAAVHTEERPFTCERCLKTYKHYGSLANHRKLHRKEDKNGGVMNDVCDGGGGGMGGGCGGGGMGGGGTSEISDSDNNNHKQGSHCDELNNIVSTTNTAAVVAATVAAASATTTHTTTTSTSIVDQASYDSILQLHSDWSTVASSINDNNNNNNNNNTYLITNPSNADTAYYTTESTHVLAGTGPVAFPDQQLTTHSLIDSNNATNQATINQSTVFMDLQLIPVCSNQNQEHTNNTILYTHVDTHHLQQQHHQSQSQSVQSQQIQQTYGNSTL